MMTENKKRDRSLAVLRPDLAAAWHPVRNNELNAEDVTLGCGKKVWWLCPTCGHEWQAIVRDRVGKGLGCQACQGKAVIPGVNDLETLDPVLASQWHPTKNGNLTPSDVMCKSSKKVWWQCEKGHEWEDALFYRSAGHKCPFCAGKRLLHGHNDLATKNPELAAQWHPTKNGALSPYDVTNFSNKKVWWKCHAGHEWEAVIANRSRGRGCPYCSRHWRVMTPTNRPISSGRTAAGSIAPANF